MHDSDELDDILNEIRNRQNPHTEVQGRRP